ncbi:MAG: mercuric reductase [Burkholderiales bacterium]|nr:mercuric reductase [Burkholderiales bacterium]
MRDLVVVGGGAAGLVVASGAAQLGLEVTLVEKEAQLGGDCLHYGCVPSKSLIHAAKVASLQRRGAEFGLAALDAKVDLGLVNGYVQRVIARIQKHDDPERFRSYGCEVLFGAPRFVDPHTLDIDGTTLRAKRFVIATGSRPAVPPIDGLAEAAYLTNLDVFSLDRLPARLVVLGGGPVGLELAQALARLGSRVTIVEMADALLPREDPEVTARLRARLEAEGIAIHTATGAQRVRASGSAKVVECRRRLDGQNVTIEADAILVAAGRRPNVEGLGLEAAGVAYSERGIGVDRRLRTSAKHVYACGDVCGPYPFTHMAEYQAGIVIANAVFRLPKRADYRVVPWVTFTDPELARVGLTEREAVAQGLAPAVLRLPFRDVDRALTESETDGLVKLVVHKGRMLGASILGPRAGELLPEIVLAMKVGAKIGSISGAIHAYPTLAQALRRAVNTYYGPKLFSPATRRLVKWMQRVVP